MAKDHNGFAGAFLVLGLPPEKQLPQKYFPYNPRATALDAPQW